MSEDAKYLYQTVLEKSYKSTSLSIPLSIHQYETHISCLMRCETGLR